LSDVDLIKRSCAANGRLLHGSRPAAAIDKMISRRAFNDTTGPNGEVYHTATYGDQFEFLFDTIIAADLKESYSLLPSYLHENMHRNSSVVYFESLFTASKGE